MIDLTGARVVVTGAGGTIGAALTRAFARAGARVVGCDLTGAGLGGESLTERHVFDLRDGAKVVEMAQAIAARGTPRIVVHAGGLSPGASTEETTGDTPGEEVDGGFSGAALLTRALLPAMRELPGDRAFVYVGTINVLTPRGYSAPFVARPAVVGWMRAVAVEEGANGIRANTVLTAPARASVTTRRLGKAADDLTTLFPLGRDATPGEIANAVLFLSSPLASAITGATLNVDAGLMAGNLTFAGALG